MEPEAGDVWVECDGQQVQGGGGAGHPEGSVVTPGRGDIKIEEVLLHLGHQNRGVVVTPGTSK